MGKLIGEDDFLARWVTWALWALAIIVCAATVTGLVESYNGLYIWFATHGIAGFWADYAPLMVDSFTVVGELAIFAGISRHWDWQSRVLPWISALLGIGASVAGNVGDKIGHPISWELTAAIPPLAGAFGIVIGLGVLKRVAKDHAEKKAAKTVSPVDAADQLMQDNRELARLLQEARSASVLDVSPPEPDRGLKGMDVLIPPQPPKATDLWTRPDIVQAVTQPHQAVSAAEPDTVSRDEARRRLSDLRPGRPIIKPDGLDVHQTGSFPAVA